MNMMPMLASLVLCLSGCANTSTFSYSVPHQPEGSSVLQDKAQWSGSKMAVATANPLATDAGYQVLRAGGTAIDAAVAIQMVLTLVEPQSSGIGGGAFLMHFNGREVEAFDGRETAPAAVDEQLFMTPDGKAMAFQEAVVGGRSVGTPGTLKMLEMAHKQHGKLAWAQLFQPAITLAEQGFPVSPRLHMLLKAEQNLRKDPVAAAYFYQPDGSPHPIGHRLENPALARVLRQIATGGASALHEGEVASAIVNKVRSHERNPGKLSLADLAGYKAIKRAPLCHDYTAANQDFRICGFPPPSSGAVAIGQILGLLSRTNANTLALEEGRPSAQWLHLYTEAARLAFADRAQYLADPEFVPAPADHWMSLLDKDYLDQRSQLIDTSPGAMSMKTAKPGRPRGNQTSYAPMPEQPEYGTSHISIVDGGGNAVAMTTTIEDAFGARQMVNVVPGMAGGFLLNNELTDFSFIPRDPLGVPVANRVEPGKRPRSSMAPTLIFDKRSGKLLASAGSPGGALIIHYTAKVIYGMLNWGLGPQQAINLPNFGSLNGPTLLEEGRFSSDTVQALNARGHLVRETNMASGLQVIASESGSHSRLLGGADPRREGLVMGD